MKIYWSNFAKTELQKIFYYYKQNVSERVAKALVLGIEKTTQILKTNPRLGHIEQLLVDRHSEFRYLVSLVFGKISRKLFLSCFAALQLSRIYTNGRLQIFCCSAANFSGSAVQIFAVKSY